MFGRKNEKQKLEAKYRKLLEESRKLSHSNRQASDAKMAEADQVRLQLEAMETTS